MKDKLTICILGTETHSCDVLWPCVESCCGMSENVLFCDIGAPDDALELMCDYRYIKRDVPTIHFDSMEMALSSLSHLDGWVMLLFPDEVVHQDAWYHVWEFSRRCQSDFSEIGRAHV